MQNSVPAPAFLSLTLLDPSSSPFRSEAALATDWLPCDSLLSSSKDLVCRQGAQAARLSNDSLPTYDWATLAWMQVKKHLGVCMVHVFWAVRMCTMEPAEVAPAPEEPRM